MKTKKICLEQFYPICPACPICPSPRIQAKGHTNEARAKAGTENTNGREVIFYSSHRDPGGPIFLSELRMFHFF